MKKKNVKKKVQVAKLVDRKFLNDLADRIYNPKTKKFLRLCDGTLQNSPDPTDETRPMHCGLGELYFAMTGKQPEETGVGESDVVMLATDLSPLNNLVERKREEAIKEIEKLHVSDEVKEALTDQIDYLSDEQLSCGSVDEFEQALENIPDENDDGCGDHSCTPAVYRKRSQRVAKQLKLAATFLPK